jgi:hypothetical protein
VKFSGFGIVPKTGGLGLQLFFFYLYQFIIDVKDASSAQARALKDL